MALTFVPKNSNAKTVFLEANFKRILYNFTAMARLFRVASFYGPFNVFDQSQTHSKETAKKSIRFVSRLQSFQ